MASATKIEVIVFDLWMNMMQTTAILLLNTSENFHISTFQESIIITMEISKTITYLTLFANFSLTFNFETAPEVAYLQRNIVSTSDSMTSVS